VARLGRGPSVPWAHLLIATIFLAPAVPINATSPEPPPRPASRTPSNGLVRFCTTSRRACSPAPRSPCVVNLACAARGADHAGTRAPWLAGARKRLEHGLRDVGSRARVRIPRRGSWRTSTATCPAITATDCFQRELAARCLGCRHTSFTSSGRVLPGRVVAGYPEPRRHRHRRAPSRVDRHQSYTGPRLARGAPRPRKPGRRCSPSPGELRGDRLDRLMVGDPYRTRPVRGGRRSIARPRSRGERHRSARRPA